LARLNQLTTEHETFHSIDGGKIKDEVKREKMLAKFMAPQTVTLGLGAQVMLIRNVDETLVNGTMGKVLHFNRDPGGERYPVVEFDLPNGMKRQMLVKPETWRTELPCGKILVSRTQVYLSL
jgi:ATP-dependent DNA helicase PIF1